MIKYKTPEEFPSSLAKIKICHETKYTHPAKVLQKGFDAVSHLFVAQTVNYTDREVPPNLSSWKA